jgi:ribosome-associated translation inhibitor RaiA
MRIDIFSPQKLVTDALREFARSRVVTELNAFAKRIKSVRLTLTDINGVRRGADKRCQAMLSIPGAQPVLVTGEGKDAYSVIDNTIELLRDALVRNLQRRRVR